MPEHSVEHLSRRWKFSSWRAALTAAALVCAAPAVSLAQQRPPGQLNTVCAADCAARGYDAEYCGRVCWVPAPGQTPPGEYTDWVCMTECRNRGGKYSECKPRCRRR